MLTRPERLAALACVLLPLAAVLMGCASPRAPEPLPKALPHYPCERIEHGRTGYHACSADEWLFQKITKGSGK